MELIDNLAFGFSVALSPTTLLYCFLGGLGYVFGPIVGTFVLFIGFEMLQGFNQYQPLIYSLLMIGLMLFLPNGLLSLGEDILRRRAAPHEETEAEDENAEKEGARHANP